MTVKKHRVSLTLDNDVYATLKLLAEKKNTSLSSVTCRLIQRVIEFEEDLYFSEVSDKRLEKKEKTISHKKARK